MMVSLRDIVLAVRYGEAALVGESAGYLVLGAADKARKNPQLATLDAITLSDDGAVHLEGISTDAEAAEITLRSLLGQLLEQVRAPCLNLQRVVSRYEIQGLAGLVGELEASLIPVNRKAAARSLARLVREAKRAAAHERSYVQVEPVKALAHSPATSVVFSENGGIEDRALSPPELLVSESPAALAPPVAPVVRTEAATAQKHRGVAVQISPAELPERRIQQPGPCVAMNSALLASVASGFAVAQSSGSTAHASGDGYTEPDVFLDDEFDEAPTQILGEAREHRVTSEVQECPELPPEATHLLSEAAQIPAQVLPVECVTVAEETLTPTRGLLALSDPSTVDVPTAALSSATMKPVPVPVPVAVKESARLAPLPLPLQPPKPRSVRRAPPKIRFLQAGRRVTLEITDEESLIPLDASAPVRRPSEIAELLDRMQISAPPMDELYKGLKNLASVRSSLLEQDVGDRDVG